MIDRENKVDVIDAKDLHKNYSKFYLSTNTPLENAKRLLHNYCVRDGLEWAPEMFQTVGKSRKPENINQVKSVLANQQITTVEELVNAVNANMKYAKDSSLMKRLVFICLQEKFPYEIEMKNDTCKLIVGMSVCHLWKYYSSYSNQVNQNDIQEDRAIKNIPIVDKSEELKNNVLYLYVVTQKGEIYFVPQFVDDVKLTHAALARKAYSILKNNPELDVISAGTVMKNQGRLYVNLASGHYLPEITAYTATLESLINNISKNETIYMQARHYYKVLDAYSCQLVDLTNVEDQKILKKSVLYYLSQLKSKDENNEKTMVIEKLFKNILSHDEYPYTPGELDLLKNDAKVKELYEKYSKHFPEIFHSTMQESPRPQ